ncbi:phosphoserine phosphatase [Ascoidea rubescens DSM 1968]|uniref:phosphoserine phosphatase n=1 Tax=Ascoidea rubescens DSM 1968 TaxID=1344418 RepID=A0A1D2VPL0_9ASCO|nr:phosphoserine phosphatase serb [Ascoidea rubescens DSM 1968]ODV63551.1 phosphoserine phosphatase serb [Ascoidea rubescens DSM 1968]
MSYSLTVIASNSEFESSQILGNIHSYLQSLPIRNLVLINLSINKAVEFQFDIIDNNNNEFEKYYKIFKTYQLNKKFGTNVDLIFQKIGKRKTQKLIVFDMDSTLIYQEVIELIASYANVEEEVKRITTSAMNGEIDFKESLRQRVLLLKGIDSTEIWDELKYRIQITNGAKEFCYGIKKKNNCKLAVLSGGFLPLANYIKEQLNLDYAFANVLEEVDGKLSGRTVGEIVDGDKKAELLIQIAQENNIGFEDIVAVGDGANDLKMMSKAGFGIAWNAKPKVQGLAPSCLNSTSLKDVFYIFGYNDNEVGELINN